VEAALSSFLSTISSDPLWLKLPNVRLVARCHPVPLIAAFGCFSFFELERLKNMATMLDEAIEHCRYVSYRDAEELAERLAMRLRQRFSREEISTFYFTTIPRGGHIVLGMLAYALDLRPDQLGDIGALLSERHNVPVVIVDDCAISGLRLQQYLKPAGDQQVVFASLLAPEGFREALMSREACIIDCLSAEVLPDLGPQRYGEGYAEWRGLQQSRMGDQGYWVGVASSFAFAWSEPQTKFWNAEARRFEAGWHLMPPHLCLKRHIADEKLQSEGHSAETEDNCTLLPQCSGPVSPDDRVLWTEIGCALAVARMPEDSGHYAPCFRLEGVAADMWRCVIEHGNLDDALAALAPRYDVDSVTLRADLVAFVADLENNGLLINR